MGWEEAEDRQENARSQRDLFLVCSGLLNEAGEAEVAARRRVGGGGVRRLRGVFKAMLTASQTGRRKRRWGFACKRSGIVVDWWRRL